MMTQDGAPTESWWRAVTVTAAGDRGTVRRGADIGSRGGNGRAIQRRSPYPRIPLFSFPIPPHPAFLVISRVVSRYMR